MFLRSKTRRKDDKEHRYWSIVENRRCQGNRVVQRQVLYLGEINDNLRYFEITEEQAEQFLKGGEES